MFVGDEECQGLLGKDYKAIKQVLLDTLGILECDESRLEQFANMLRVEDVEREDEGEKRSIPGMRSFFCANLIVVC